MPLLTITDNVAKCPKEAGAPVLIADSEVDELKYKKYVIVTARVHPGETPASFIMEGFLRFLTSDSQEAQELRRKNVFKVVPMLNPDGVVAGNYRTSASGNDLNRQFIDPCPNLHPEVSALRTLVGSINSKALTVEPIRAYIDIHGHSKKKSVFIYGPEYALHSDRYFKARVIPKLLDENSALFRFHSCRFTVLPSKQRAARVVINREFGVMNCFTLEASMSSYIDSDRRTVEFTQANYEEMGRSLAETLQQYCKMIDEDLKQKKRLKSQLQKSKST